MRGHALSDVNAPRSVSLNHLLPTLLSHPFPTFSPGLFSVRLLGCLLHGETSLLSSRLPVLEAGAPVNGRSVELVDSPPRPPPSSFDELTADPTSIFTSDLLIPSSPVQGADDDGNLYDEVDEDAYDDVVKSRLERDDFIEDDVENSGYVDDGREDTWGRHDQQRRSDDDDASDEDPEDRRKRRGQSTPNKLERSIVGGRRAR